MGNPLHSFIKGRQEFICMFLLFPKISRTATLILLLIFAYNFTFCAGNNLPKNLDELKAGKKISGSEATTWLKNKPVKFLENKGQMVDMNSVPVPFVLFKAESPGLNLYITEKGLTYVFIEFEEKKEAGEHAPGRETKEEKKECKWERVDMDLDGAIIRKENIIKEDPLQGHKNYFYSHCPDGINNVKEYGRITIRDIYPGIDWVLYNSGNTGFKYDFIIHPGADSKNIEIVYSSLKPFNLDEQGNLVFRNRSNRLTENAPYSYVMETGKIMESHFEIKSEEKINDHYQTVIGFNLNKFDNSKTFIIDPQLTWGTFYGGNHFDGTISLEVDPSGNIFAMGYTASLNFQVQNSGSFFQGSVSSGTSLFILKFDENTALIWATYYGNSSSTFGSMACNASGDVYITGVANGTTFPTQNSGGYYQSTHGGGGVDGFILKFDNSGNRLWATYFGGSGLDYFRSIDIDVNGKIFISGSTNSNNFPVQNAGTYFNGVITGTVLSGFILKIDESENLLWSTYFEKVSGEVVTVAGSGDVYVTGSATPSMTLLNPGGGAYFQTTITGTVSDAFILKFDNTGNLLWSTYYGGSDYDMGQSIATDKNGNVFVVGLTISNNFPVQNSGGFYQPNNNSAPTYHDLFILKFNSAGVRLWATYFGGSKSESLGSNDNIEIDSCGNVYIAFNTGSSNTPTQTSCNNGYQDNSLDTTSANTLNDIFLTRFSNSGVYQWGTYIGGNGHDFRSSVDLDKKENIYLTGEWAYGTTSAITASYPITKFGPTSYVDSTSNGLDDVYMLKFSFLPYGQSFSYGSAACNNEGARMPVTSLNFAGGGIYSASPGLSINPVSGQIYPSSSSVGSYTIHYALSVPASSCSCTSSATIGILTTFTILGSPTLSVVGTKTICAGEIATQTVSGASTYTWSIGVTTNTINLKPPSTYIYSVTGTSANGCKGTQTVQIVVNKCLGISERELNSEEINIYPNPNSGEFTIEGVRDMDLRLVNETGQHIRSLKITADKQYKVIVKDLAPGLYFLYDVAEGDRPGRKIIVEK